MHDHSQQHRHCQSCHHWVTQALSGSSRALCAVLLAPSFVHFLRKQAILTRSPHLPNNAPITLLLFSVDRCFSWLPLCCKSTGTFPKTEKGRSDDTNSTHLVTPVCLHTDVQLLQSNSYTFVLTTVNANLWRHNAFPKTTQTALGSDVDPQREIN